MISRTIDGPAAVKSCIPILNIPTTPRNAVKSSRARAAVSTSSAMMSLSFDFIFIEQVQTHKVSIHFDLVDRVLPSSSFRFTTDPFIEGADAFTLQNLGESFIDPSRRARALVDESGIKLNQTCSRANFLPGIFGGEHSAHADDWQRTIRQAINQRNDSIRALPQRRAA